MKDKFWITGIGRSGTTKVAKLLNEVSDFRVEHERADPRNAAIAHSFRPFPINRFLDEGKYGECHGILRYNLSMDFPGPEQLIDKRAVLFRDMRKVVLSWMNHDGREAEDIGATCYEVLRAWQSLELYCERDIRCRIFDFEQLMSELPYLQDFYDHLGIEVTALPSHMKEVVNKTRNRKFSWNATFENIFRRTNERLWKPLRRGSEFITQRP